MLPKFTKLAKNTLLLSLCQLCSSLTVQAEEFEIKKGQVLPVPWVIQVLFERSSTVQSLQKQKQDLGLEISALDENFKNKLSINTAFTKLNDQVFFFNMNGNNTQVISGDINFEKQFRFGVNLQAKLSQRYTHSPCGLSLSPSQDLTDFQNKITYYGTCVRICTAVNGATNPALATCIAGCGAQPTYSTPNVPNPACTAGAAESVVDRKFWNSALKFTMLVPLWSNGLGKPFRIQEKITHIANLISALKIDGDLNNLVTAVIGQYYQIAFFLDDLDARKSALKRAEKLNQINENKLATGRSDRSEVLTTRASLVDRQKDIQNSKLNLKLALMKLAQILGVPYRDEIDVKAQLEPIGPKHELEQALEYAIRYRADLKQLETQKEALKAQIILQKERLKTGVNLFANYELNGSTIDYVDAIKMRGYNYTVGLNFTVPIDEVGAEVKVQQLAAQMRNLDLMEAGIKDQITVEVKEQIMRMSDLENQKTELQKLVALKEERVQHEMRKYELGRSTTDLLTRFEDDLDYSRLMYLKARVDYAVALMTLYSKENYLLKFFTVPSRTID